MSADDLDFLDYFQACVKAGEPVSASAVKRLKRLADYAETAHPPPGWVGTVNLGETERAVTRARAIITEKDQGP